MQKRANFTVTLSSQVIKFEDFIRIHEKLRNIRMVTRRLVTRKIILKTEQRDKIISSGLKEIMKQLRANTHNLHESSDASQVWYESVL